MQSKIIVASLAIVTLVIVGTQTINTVRADEGNVSSHPMMQGLVERFNLNEDEVETYFNEQMEDMGHHAINKENMLNDAVNRGAISTEQKELLLNKMEEMKQHREEEKAEMQTWAEENDIDLSLIHMGRGGFKDSGMGHKGI